MSDKRDYRDTVFLPKTDFPMKAGLPQKEPGILAKWQADGLYQQLRKARAGREKFVLHDGPPYANGDIHIGHALNKVLKDAVVRTQSLLGKDAPYVPGWDCHGLPIEWKVEEQYRKKKRNKDEVPPREFRAECREYAAKWVDVQREQFKRLGITGDWDDPYLTMAPEAEAGIVAELLKFAESGQLYRGAKPVMWSPVEKTALAEAEVEYEDIVSTQIDVAFEITKAPNDELLQKMVDSFGSVKALIWTTTPWTIPINQGLAYGPEIEYVLKSYRWDDDTKKAGPFLFARELEIAVTERLGIPLVAWGDGISAPPASTLHWYGKGSDLAGTVARHPMHHLGGFFAEPRPLLPGDFVTTDSGTGLVHMAPDHGEDDFELCKAHGIGPKFAVDNGGLYRDDWLWLGGDDERRRSVINPNFNAPDGPICSDLREAGALLAASTDYQHSYPHSWRSKAKVIFRCTPQWFVPMDKESDDQTLRGKALSAIAETRFVPEKGRNRIGSMVEGRPDWVLSRQRAWGVPITLFVHRESGEYLVDAEVNARIIAAIEAEGVDAWDEANAQAFLGNDYAAEDYEMIPDILDVWFDSGSTHAFVLESGRWPDLQSPADLYLEGSDQHRGWFQSSLLESCATRGRAPYKAVLTHGFTMASDGRKMSKSLGNTIDPNKVMEEFGADIIRLWALSVDYTEDHRIGPEILKGVADQYRKLRNTFRYMLGALEGFNDTEKVLNVSEMPELERYMLALLGELDAKLRKAVDAFDFNTYTRALTDFANEDLSAFFFDIRKDRLYCDAPDGLERRAYRTVLDTLFHALIRYSAPVLVYTAEEVWTTRYPDAGSVHLLEWPEVPSVDSAELKMRFRLIRSVREQAYNVLEPMRRSKEIGSSLMADLRIEPANEANFHILRDVDLATYLIVSSVVISKPTNGFSVIPSNPDDPETPFSYGGALIAGFLSPHHKCGRCWRLLPEVTEDGELCHRCEDVVAEMDEHA